MIEKPEIISRKQLHSGYVRVEEVDFEVPRQIGDGTTMTMRREVLLVPDAVVVLVDVPAAKSFLLLREVRSGVLCNEGGDDPLIWQCVAGALDKELSPEQTAREELREEAGIDAGSLDLIPVAQAYASPGRMTEKVWLYCVRLSGIPSVGIFGLAGESEDIRTALVPYEQAYRMVERGEIMDSMTLLGLNWYWRTYL